MEQLDLVEGEIISTELTLFGSNDPARILERAVQVSGLLERVIRERRLYTSIHGRDHVRVEGWTLLGSMLGLFPYTVWTRRLEDGWEARVEARTLDGRAVVAAESECLRSEKEWGPNPTRGKPRDDYALRSMAQTRATSKALRQPLGFVMHLAGFETTPADEMPEITGEARPPIGSQPGGRAEPVLDPEPEEGEWWEPDHDPADERLPAAGPPAPAVAGPPATAGQLLSKLHASYREHGITELAARREFASVILGLPVASSKELTVAEIHELLAALDSTEAFRVSLRERLITPLEEPEPEPGPELASPAQRAQLIQLLEQKNLDGQARLNLLEEITGRKVNAVDGLTVDEADQAISALGGRLPLHTPP
ncbi:MAG TPA: hypothetical protein VIG37_16865 [Methylomirabilota bacterium]